MNDEQLKYNVRKNIGSITKNILKTTFGLSKTSTKTE
jgi:hypothetical protein